MSPVSSYLLGILITLVASLALVLFLRTHLRRILVDLCGTQERAGFWAAFSNALLVLIPLICSLFPEPRGGDSASTFFGVSAQLKWGLIGLVVAVLVLGIVITRFIPKTPGAR